MRNSAQRPPLDSLSFDVAVIGGGINGVAIARECARAGRRTLLVERRDFASGTTSRSTRIIHGGLRYLRHGEIALVRESLRDRDRLLRSRPHLVRPLEFLLALPPGGRSALQVRFGLWLYRRFARAIPRQHQGGSVARLDRLLQQRGDPRGWSVFSYDDAQCEFPERLVAEWLAEALAAGLTVRNYTEALQVIVSGGRVRGLRLRDAVNGREYRVDAAAIVNATGPWVDRFCRTSAVDTKTPLVGGVRGSHLLLPRFPGAPEAAVYTEASDGRPVFCIPWNGQVLLGTTEIADAGDPSRTAASPAEIGYLLACFQRLFPSVPIGPGDIRAAFAGVRPLPYAPGRGTAAITRRHLLRDHADDGASGLISIIGGKLTTAATLARECARRLGISVPEPALHALIGFDGLAALLDAYACEAAVTGRLPMPAARALTDWHGRNAHGIARRAADDPALAEPICDHTPHIVAEAVHAVELECAVTLADILLRRVPIALGACWSEACTRASALRIGSALGWSETEIAREQEAFTEEYSAFLTRPSPVPVRLSAA